MPVFNPTQRNETRLFQQIDVDAFGNPVYRQLKYALVQYGSNPEQFVEPISNETVWYTGANGAQIARPIASPTNGSRITAIKFFNARPFRVFSFDDYDVNVGIAQ